MFVKKDGNARYGTLLNIIAAAGALVCLFGTTVFNAQAAEGLPAFSADIVQHSRGQDAPMTSKIYLAKDKCRIEIGAGHGVEAVIITRIDRGVSWTLMPAQKMYIEAPIQPENRMYTEAITERADTKYIGTETIDGVAADKYLSGSEPVAFYTWIAKSTKIPLKIAKTDGSFTAEYKNIKIGEPPAVLFDIPDGYQKMPGVPGGMPDDLSGVPLPEEE